MLFVFCFVFLLHFFSSVFSYFFSLFFLRFFYRFFFDVNDVLLLFLFHMEEYVYVCVGVGKCVSSFILFFVFLLPHWFSYSCKILNWLCLIRFFHWAYLLEPAPVPPYCIFSLILTPSVFVWVCGSVFPLPLLLLPLPALIQLLLFDSD